MSPNPPYRRRRLVAVLAFVALIAALAASGCVTIEHHYHGDAPDQAAENAPQDR